MFVVVVLPGRAFRTSPLPPSKQPCKRLRTMSCGPGVQQI